MSYTYLLEGAEAYSAECFAGIPASAPSKSSPIAAKFCSKGSETECCRSSRFGTTCGHSTAGRGGGKSTSSAAASRARTFPRRTERPSESAAKEAAYGAKWPASSGKSGLNTSLRKTRRCSKAGVSSASSKTSTRSVTTRGASNSELKISAKRYGKGFGFWGVVQASRITHGMSAAATLNTKYGVIVSSAHRRFLESFGHLPPAGVCGMGDGVPHRLDRLATVGNAQIPVVAALAFTVLKGSFDNPEIEKSTLRKPSAKPLRKAV